MKPETTGWLRKFARKPSRSRPMPSRNKPLSSASTLAAMTYSAVVLSPNPPSAAAVMRETTATGPTDNARLEPKTA